MRQTYIHYHKLIAMYRNFYNTSVFFFSDHTLFDHASLLVRLQRELQYNSIYSNINIVTVVSKCNCKQCVYFLYNVIMNT